MGWDQERDKQEKFLLSDIHNIILNKETFGNKGSRSNGSMMEKKILDSSINQ